jgi:peptidoglycan hydrolase CwlO-like protein
MTAMRTWLVLLGALSQMFMHVAGEGMRLNVNPIRRVVTMLQMMQHKVEEEGKTEQELFDKFMCYCKNGVGELEKSIKDAEAKVAQLESSIEETDATLQQLKSDIEKAKADREEAKGTMDKAKALRENEAKAFAKMSSDSKTNIAAMKKATAAIKKGTGTEFLQTRAAADLKRLSISMDLATADREMLGNFLSSGSDDSDSDGYTPSSGEITGILEQMQETLEKELAQAEKEEAEGIKQYEALMAAKAKQVATLTKEIQTKMVRKGETGVELAAQKEDFDDTSKSLAEDKKFLVDITKDCATKEAQKQANDKMRATELLALADTIKILNDDDALDLFKKTLPTPSLLQLQVSQKQTKEDALKVLAKGKRKHKDYRVNLISMALRGKKVSFDKVIGMIDNMLSLLAEEQKSDDGKKEYCERNLDETEDELKSLQGDMKDLEKAIAEHKASTEKVVEDLDALTQGIKDLDKQVDHLHDTILLLTLLLVRIGGLGWWWRSCPPGGGTDLQESDAFLLFLNIDLFLILRKGRRDTSARNASRSRGGCHCAPHVHCYSVLF